MTLIATVEVFAAANRLAVANLVIEMYRSSCFVSNEVG